jgi:hypothetical protein
MRKVFVLAIIMITMGCLVARAIALPDRGRSFSKVDKQSFRFRTGPTTISRAGFRQIFPLALDTCSRGGVTFSFSGTFSGGPVELRLMHGFVLPGKRLPPGVAHFNPGRGKASFSFTWGLRSARLDGHSLRMEWRSGDGRPVTLHGGLTRVLFNDGEGCL